MIRKAALQIGVPALLAFIAWNAYLAVTHLKSVERSAALTLESSAIQAELSGVLKDVTDLEAGQRGYLLTGNAAYLQPYADAKGRIEMDFANLRAGLSTRTQRERSLESQLESLATSKQAEMERSISLQQLLPPLGRPRKSKATRRTLPAPARRTNSRRFGRRRPAGGAVGRRDRSESIAGNFE